MPIVDDSRRIDDLRIVLETTRALQVEKDIDALLNLLLAAATRVVGADRSSLFLVDHATAELYSKIAEGEEGEEIRFPMGAGIAGSVANTREVINIENAYDDSRFNPEIDKKTGYRTHTILCVPLVTHEDKVVGVIQCLNKVGGTFDGYDIEILEALSIQAAVAIDNHQLAAHYLDKQKIQASLGIAREIQAHLLPGKTPNLSGYDVGASCVACDETGGDYFDFFTEDPDRLGVVVGDVSGHGVGSAIVMATARASLRALRSTLTDVEQVVKRLNNLLVDDLHHGRFMTLFHGSLDYSEGIFRYVSAGHDAPIHYHHAKNEFSSLDSTGLPLGWVSEDDGYRLDVEEISFGEGDILVLMTDGIWEAVNEDKEAFGKERMCDIILRMKDRSAQEIVDQLFEEMESFCGQQMRQDDVTVLVVRRFVADESSKP
ncbi:MAG: SpoIIE family protein phosphatase [Planctomycetota bacterium]|nr:SpoIIE family protein phosphatase [Planctomycetota bacterium]